MEGDRAAATLRDLFVAARGYRSFRRLSPTTLRARGHPRKHDVLVVLCLDGKLGIKPLRDLAESLAPERHVLLVYEGAITSFARQELARMRDGGRKTIELFNVQELQFDLTKHALVPRYEECTPQALRQEGLVAEQLPVLLATDPVARWYDWRRGTVVRTTMHSPEGHSFHEYRVVK